MRRGGWLTFESSAGHEEVACRPAGIALPYAAATSAGV